MWQRGEAPRAGTEDGPARRDAAGDTHWRGLRSGSRVADRCLLLAVWVLGPGSELALPRSPGYGADQVDPGPELGGG